MKKRIKIMNYIVSGLLFALMIFSFKFVYYNIAPVEYFIDFQSFDLQDYKATDKTQIVIVYRNSTLTTTADFKFKTFCNWQTSNEWSTEANHIILNKTDWLERIVVESPLDNKLPKWNCILYINIKLDINWYTRYIELQDNFKVL